MENKILQAIENLDKKFEGLDKKVENLDKKIDTKIDALDKKFIKELKLHRAETKEDLKLHRAETKEEFRLLKIQTKENTQILQALMHSAEVNKAEQDQMMIKLSKVEGTVENIKIEVSGLRKDLSTMEVVTANNYADLAKLKAVR